MSYGICRCAKIKGASAGAGSYIHNERQAGKSHTNPDIDFARSEQNYSVGEYDTQLDYNQRAEERIKEGYKGAKAVRKDAVKQVEFVFTSDQEFFQGQEDGGKAYFEDCYKWACDRYGKDNIIADTVHLDETTPHMHLHIVPLTEDGRLSCKEVIGNRQDLQAMQDDFYNKVSSKYGLERGERYDFEKEAQGIDQEKPRAHKSLAQMKQNEAQELEKLQQEQKKAFDDVQRMRGERVGLQKDLKTAQKELEGLQGNINTLNDNITAKKGTLNDIQRDIDSKETQLDQLKEIEKQLKEKKDSVEILTQKEGDTLQRIREREKELESIEKFSKLKQKSLETLENRAQQTTREIASKETQLEQLEIKVDSLQKDIDRLGGRKTEAEKELQATHRSTETAKKELEGLQGDINTLKTEQGQIKADNEKLRGVYQKNKGIVDKLDKDIANKKADYLKILKSPPKVREVTKEVIKEIPKEVVHNLFVDYKQDFETALEAFKKVTDNFNIDMPTYQRLGEGKGGESFLRAYKTIYPRSPARVTPLGDPTEVSPNIRGRGR